jgi:carbon storage regulator
MLVLSRKHGERVVIGGDIVITVIEARDGRVRLGFEAPQGTPIHREEVFEKIARAEASVPDKSDREESKFYVECG